MIFYQDYGYIRSNKCFWYYSREYKCILKALICSFSGDYIFAPDFDYVYVTFWAEHDVFETSVRRIMNKCYVTLEDGLRAHPELTPEIQDSRFAKYKAECVARSKEVVIRPPVERQVERSCDTCRLRVSEACTEWRTSPCSDYVAIQYLK